MRIATKKKKFESADTKARSLEFCKYKYKFEFPIMFIINILTNILNKPNIFS